MPQKEKNGGYVEANPARFEVNKNGDVNLEIQLKRAVGKNGYLRPMSKPENFTFVEESKNSGMNS